METILSLIFLSAFMLLFYFFLKDENKIKNFRKNLKTLDKCEFHKNGKIIKGIVFNFCNSGLIEVLDIKSFKFYLVDTQNLFPCI